MTIALALLLVASVPAASEPAASKTVAAPAADPLLEKCIKVSNGTNFEFQKCYGEALKRADERLNLVWKQALSDVGGRDSEAGKSLVDEQRAWITFKEKACGFYWTKEFGSMHRSIIGPSCALDIIRARIGQLDEISSFFEAYRGEE
ncbi:MAG: lysozyme inhibitor LprI family protein [Sphingorhabdus sp.]